MTSLWWKGGCCACQMGTLPRRQMTFSAFLFLFQLAQANPCQQEGCTGCFLDKVFPDHSSSSGILISNGSNFEIFPAELNCDIPPLKPQPEGDIITFSWIILPREGKTLPFGPKHKPACCVWRIKDEEGLHILAAWTTRVDSLPQSKVLNLKVIIVD